MGICLCILLFFSFLGTVLGDSLEIDICERIKKRNATAILVGINHYNYRVQYSERSPSLGSLSLSIDDVESVGKELKKIGNIQISLMTDIKDQQSSLYPTKSNILAQIQKAKKSDLLIFFFSGHGDENHIFTSPSHHKPIHSIQEIGLHIGKLLEELGNTNAKEIIVILDSCRDKSYFDSEIHKGITNFTKNIKILFSTLRFQKGYENYRLSKFLIQALKGELGDSNNRITTNEFIAQVKNSVIQESKRNQVPIDPSTNSAPITLYCNKTKKKKVQFPETEESYNWTIPPFAKSMVVPGWGQYEKNNYDSSRFFAVSSVIVGTIVAINIDRYQKAKESFNNSFEAFLFVPPGYNLFMYLNMEKNRKITDTRRINLESSNIALSLLYIWNLFNVYSEPDKRKGYGATFYFDYNYIHYINGLEKEWTIYSNWRF